jgi:hypothetical protein
VDLPGATSPSAEGHQALVGQQVRRVRVHHHELGYGEHSCAG